MEKCLLLLHNDLVFPSVLNVLDGFRSSINFLFCISFSHQYLPYSIFKKWPVHNIEMISLFTLVLTTIPIYWVYSNIAGLQKNVAAAKRSGLPYVIARELNCLVWPSYSNKF